MGSDRLYLDGSWWEPNEQHYPHELQLHTSLPSGWLMSLEHARLVTFAIPKPCAGEPDYDDSG